MPLRRRRPLLRAAAVGGGAYAMGKRHAQQSMEDRGMQEAVPAPGPERPGMQEPAPRSAAAPPANGPSAEDLERLQQLAKLNKEGVITDQELAEQKARILG